MKTFDYMITDEVGIHARPAGNLAKLCKQLGAKVTLEADGKSADAEKLMAVMAMGIKKGTTVTVKVEGDQEESAAAEVEKFFQEDL